MVAFVFPTFDIALVDVAWLCRLIRFDSQPIALGADDVDFDVRWEPITTRELALECFTQVDLA
jgi:hypothetical protein